MTKPFKPTQWVEIAKDRIGDVYLPQPVVYAEIYGQMCVHARYGVDLTDPRRKRQRDNFSVTHVATGLSTGANYLTLTKARQLAQDLDKLPMDEIVNRAHTPDVDKAIQLILDAKRRS